MPTVDYKCFHCGSVEEHILPAPLPRNVKCGKCGKRAIRIFTLTEVQAAREHILVDLLPDGPVTVHSAAEADKVAAANGCSIERIRKW
jgi:DNA-directed RNA polymerase subunit RPC12/RpoP